MKLGTLELVNRYILAPMQNVTTAPYRRFCRKFQEIGLVSVPMLYTKRITKNPKFLEHILYKIEEERPISIQLIGSDIGALRKSIDYLESYNFDILDINAGCPSRRAIHAKEGGYLMKDLRKLNELLQAVVKKSSKPVSLKIRTGFEKPMNIDEVSTLINNSGISLLTIHARTVKSNFLNDALDLNTVKKLKERINIPLVGNGDITTPLSAKHFIDYTKVDAFMVGRETMGNPVIFQQIHDYLTKGINITFKNSLALVRNYINIYEDIVNNLLNEITYPFGNDEFKFNELKRNSIWLMKNIRNSTKIRTQLSKTKNLIQLKASLKEIFNS
ncbi:MAG: tRNA dihydrouridine synthase [Candidatus Thorarchaeota archaeon]